MVLKIFTTTTNEAWIVNAEIRDASEKDIQRNQSDCTRGIQGFWDGQAEGYSHSHEGNQSLEDKNGTKLHYLNQSQYIPCRNESGATK